MRLNLDLHSDEVRYPNTNAQPVPPHPNAFLLGDESTASLLNDRGTVRLRLSTGGGCGDSTVNFDGDQATTVAAPAISGRSSPAPAPTRVRAARAPSRLVADVAPGADNPFDLDLDGSLTVRQPTLDVEVAGTFWGNLGLDYVTRRVSVTYRITNTGPGHAFGARLTGDGAADRRRRRHRPGAAGRSATSCRASRSYVTVRYQLHTRCSRRRASWSSSAATSQARVDVTWPTPSTSSRTPNETLGAKAPLLPPPL